jgi:hypothetical protein
MNTAITKQSLAEQAGGHAPASRASQGTMIEQSRAIAEVQGSIVLAQQRPRDTTRAIEDMRMSCGIKEMADCAFFKFPRGGSNITGASVQLARELARCWGNIDYGIKELSRNDGQGQSEMLAFAWDLETNVRAETTFIVPHLRDKKGGPERLVDVRDIYEVNANMGARRLREQIFAVLPRWFTEQAEQACHDTLQNGGGEPLPLRITKMVEAFAQLGITKKQLEKKVAGSIDKIDPVTLANLAITYKSIRRGEISKDDEFPDDKAASIEGALKGGEEKRAPVADKATPIAEQSAAAVARSQLQACKTEAEIDDLWERLPIEICRELGADAVETAKAELVRKQAVAPGQAAAE